MLITFYDIETNGLERDSEILEFGFVRCKQDFTLVSAGQLFFWQDGWDVGRTDIHGLTVPMMEQHKSKFVINMSQMYGIMKDAHVVGKNNHAFDDKVLNSFVQRHTFAEDKSISLKTTYASSADIQVTHSKKWKELLKAKGIDTGRERGTLEQYLSAIDVSPEIVGQYCTMCGIQMRGNLMHSAAVDAMATYIVARMYATKFGVLPIFD